jgi:predicted amidohydrolase
MKHDASDGPLRMRVAAWQSRLQGHDPQVHADVMRRCADEAVDLLVLPECYFGGMPKTDHDARAQAIPAPYLPLVDESTGSHPITVIAGFVERATTDRLYSSAVIIRAGRVSAVARKLFPIEPAFAPGETLSTFPVGGTKVGVVICHDANFIEPARLLARAGARVLACPLNNDLRPQVAAEWATRTRSNLIARAVENDCWVIAADVCGRTTARVGLGATAIVGPDGRVIAQADPTREHLLVADIDIAANSMLSRWDVHRNPAVFDLWSRAQTH